jgi:hypothetical protein
MRFGIDLDREARRPRHRGRERLRAAHAAEPAVTTEARFSVPSEEPKSRAAAATNVSYVPCRIPWVPM